VIVRFAQFDDVAERLARGVVVIQLNGSHRLVGGPRDSRPCRERLTRDPFIPSPVALPQSRGGARGAY
jgi:hypothetical protein